MHVIIKKAAIYIDSKESQENQKNQLRKLQELANNRGFLVEKEYTGTEVENKAKKTGLLKLIIEAQKREFDILLVLNLDSLGKTLLAVNKILSTLHTNNIDLIALENGLETEKNRDLIYSVIKSLVNFESRTKSILIKAGQKNARHKGKKLGRPRLPLSVFEKALDLRSAGNSYRQIGYDLNIDESTIRKWTKAGNKNKEKN